MLTTVRPTSSAALLLATLASGCSGGTVEAPDSATSIVDVGTAVDASGTANDARPDAFAAIDANGADASADCDPSRVRFPGSGSLVEGQLCDDVFACVPTSTDAAALQVASPAFDCSGPTEGGCSGVSCVLRPSILDATEIQQICAVTLLPNVTDLVCNIYL